MKLVVDIHFDGDSARVAALGFDDWAAAEPDRTWETPIAAVDKAKPGQRDARKPPCVLQLLRAHQLTPELIVIDGLVHLDPQETPGWGRALFEALGGTVPVIGISKQGVQDWPAQYQVAREDEAPPVVVTSAGIDIGAAKARVAGMHGRRRVPTLMKRVVRAAKGAAGD